MTNHLLIWMKTDIIPANKDSQQSKYVGTISCVLLLHCRDDETSPLVFYNVAQTNSCHSLPESGYSHSKKSCLMWLHKLCSLACCGGGALVREWEREWEWLMVRQCPALPCFNWWSSFLMVYPTAINQLFIISIFYSFFFHLHPWLSP